MKKRIAKIWIEALRSGQWKQGQEALRNGINSFCCLGVLCDLYHQKTGEGTWTFEDNGWAFRDEEGKQGQVMLTEAVSNWAGLTTRSGEVDSESLLVKENDTEGSTFETIADIIEDNWKAL